MNKMYWENNKLYFNNKLMLDVVPNLYYCANLTLNNKLIYESATFNDIDKENIEKIIGTDECKMCGMPENLFYFSDKTLTCLYCRNKINIKIED